MTGWAGGAANRTWQRGRRGADSGRLGAVEDVQAILHKFRVEHGWEPGMVWNPYRAEYVHEARPAPQPGEHAP